jgi:hypothetical protein
MVALTGLMFVGGWLMLDGVNRMLQATRQRQGKKKREENEEEEEGGNS